MLGWLPYTHAQVGVVWTCVAFEHVVVLLKMALRVTTATVPQHVVDDRFREAYFHQKVGGCRCVHKGGARLVAQHAPCLALTTADPRPGGSAS